jgi:hypothetical protein
MTEAAVLTLEEVAEQHKTEIRDILSFVVDNIKALTPLHFNKEKKTLLRDQVKIWRFFLSHTFFDEPFEDLNADKPPLSWLHNLLISHRSVKDLITLLAAPGVRESMDLKNGADILMLKLSRITSYTAPLSIPNTFYLPLGDPKKTDQYGIPFKDSLSRAAEKWRRRLSDEAAAKESLEPEEKPELTEAEKKKRTKAYLKIKNAQRAAERERRKLASDDADRRYEQEKREDEKRRKEKYGN